MTNSIQTLPRENLRLQEAVDEVFRRRPTQSKLPLQHHGQPETQPVPAPDEFRKCCEAISWSTPAAGVRHLCTVKHIAALYGVPHQQLLNAVWDRESHNLSRRRESVV